MAQSGGVPPVAAGDSIARASAACRAFLLAAPVSLDEATRAAAAAMTGNFSPAAIASKHPIAFWAAASTIISCPPPPPWTEPARFVHATTAAAAAALALYASARDFREQLAALYAAALASEPPEFVCRAIASHTHVAIGAASAVLGDIFLRGAPPPRVMFSAYAGLVTATYTHAAGVPSAPHAGVYEGRDTASEHALRFCAPVIFDAPRCIEDIYFIAYNAAGAACDQAIADGRWVGAHLMDRFLFEQRDPLDVQNFPVSVPRETVYGVDTGLVAADGRANAWAMYDFAAQLDHTGIFPVFGPRLSRALCARFKTMDFSRVRWVRAQTVVQLTEAGEKNRCIVLCPGGAWIETPDS